MVTTTPTVHMTPWQFQRNQIRKKKQGNGGSHPGGGDEWTTSKERHQFPSPEEYKENSDPDFLWRLILWVHPDFPLKCELWLSINCISFPAFVLLLNSFLRGDNNPITAAPGWVLSWTLLWASGRQYLWRKSLHKIITGETVDRILEKSLLFYTLASDSWTPLPLSFLFCNGNNYNPTSYVLVGNKYFQTLRCGGR